MFSLRSVIVALTLISLFFAIAFTTYLLSPVSIGSARDIRIFPGDGVEEIGKLLEEESLIKSSFAFKIYTFFRGAASQLKPGKYLIDVTKLFSQHKPRIYKLEDGKYIVDLQEMMKHSSENSK